MIQISNAGVTSDPEDVARLREEFRAVNCVRIPQLLHPSLLAFLQRRLEQAEWKSKSHGAVGEEIALESVTEDRAALHLLHFITNLAPFRALIEQITGCGPLKMFHGRVYRMNPSLGHFDSWHDDDFENRLIGISINLSPAGFRGGLFELRTKDTEEVLAQIANTGLGDALVFKISGELQHQVSPIEGDEPKTAFAGWFQPDLPDFFESVVESSRKKSTSGIAEIKV